MLQKGAKATTKQGRGVNQDGRKLDRVKYEFGKLQSLSAWWTSFASNWDLTKALFCVDSCKALRVRVPLNETTPTQTPNSAIRYPRSTNKQVQHKWAQGRQPSWPTRIIMLRALQLLLELHLADALNLLLRKIELVGVFHRSLETRFHKWQEKKN